MRFKNFSICVLMLFFIFPSVIFAKQYTEAEVTGREMGFDASTGTSYVKEGQPIITESTFHGEASTEAFEYNGQVYPKGTVMYTIDENGITGNVKEGQSITYNDPSLIGSKDNTVVIKGKGECINRTINENGEVVFVTPTVKITGYNDQVYDAAAYIERLNSNDLLMETISMTGWSEITMENFNQISQMVNIGTLEDGMVFLGEGRTESEQYLQLEWNAELGSYVMTGVDKKEGVVLVIDGSGPDAENIFFYWVEDKLYAVYGDGEVEMIPDEDTTTNPEDPGPGGNTSASSARWTGYGAASMSASVSSDKYNVSEAIPTSENITGNVSALDMSWSYAIDMKNVTKSYPFVAHLAWDWGVVSTGYYDSNNKWVPKIEYGYRQHDSEDITGVYTTHYFYVVHAEMSRLSSAYVSNETTGTLATVGPASITGNLSRNGNVITIESLLPDSVSGSSYANSRSAALANAKANATAAIKAATYAQNDTMVMKNGGLSGVTPLGEEFGDNPYGNYSSLSNPTPENLGNSGTKMIPSDKTNGWYSSSAGASYSAVPSFDGKPDSAGASPSNVFVHTPVVNRATITVDAFINQKVTHESGITYLQLDRGFTVNIPDDGIHIGAQGYGSRTYNSNQAVTGYPSNWGKIKDVKVPFDAYLQPSNTLIKAGTWLSDYGLATTQTSYTFLVPVWAEEDKGEIEIRVVAENIPVYTDGSSCPTGLLQDGANLDYTKYIAEKKILVEVIGKIYDLRISSTNDPGWPEIKGKDGPYVAAQEFPFGQAGQNSHKQYRFAPKLGYIVEFDFKTKGVKTDNVDVSVQPEGFYFVSKDGGEAQEVDLFFKTVTNQYIKIDPSTNNSDIIVNLSNQFMRVVVQEIIDSRRIMIDQVGVTYTYNQNVPIGQLPALKMPEKLRLCYNNFAEYINRLYGKSEAGITADANGGLSYSTGKYDAVNNGKDTVIASVGHWYAGYRLPSSTIAVPKGTTVNQILRNPNIAKKNGYILVKFDIVGKNGDEDYLRYTGPESITEPGQYTKDEDGKEQKWQDPQGNPDPTSPKQDIELPNGKPAIVPDGSVILFETDLKANNDYEVIGTH